MVTVDWFVAAALPIALAWLLWRLQAVCVNRLLRGGMYRLLRYQRTTYAFVSWFGVLVHEISHALVLMVGGHGIRRIKVGVDAGHVTPRQVRKGPIGTLTFIAAALAPMVAAPIAVAALLLLGGLRLPAPVADAGVLAAWENLMQVAMDVPERLVIDLVGMDVTTGVGAALFLLAVFAMPSARPSHVKVRGEADEGDIAVVRRLIKKRPWPVLAFAFLVWASYFVASFTSLRWYWLVWEGIWMVALVGIVLAAIMGVVWYAVAWTGRIQTWIAWLPYAIVVAVQVGARLWLPDVEIWTINGATVAAFLAFSAGLLAVAPRRY